MKINYLQNGLMKHAWKRYRTRDLAEIKEIVIHHFASDATIEQVARFHVTDPDHLWAGIGYWVVIDFDGSANVVNDITAISYQTGGRNTRTLGIAMRGNYSDSLPRETMLNTLSNVITSVRLCLGRDIQVDVHRDYRNTSCPGDALAEWVREKYPSELRVRVAALPDIWSRIRAFFRKKDRDRYDHH